MTLCQAYQIMPCQSFILIDVLRPLPCPKLRHPTLCLLDLNIKRNNTGINGAMTQTMRRQYRRQSVLLVRETFPHSGKLLELLGKRYWAGCKIYTDRQTKGLSWVPRSCLHMLNGRNLQWNRRTHYLTGWGIKQRWGFHAHQKSSMLMQLIFQKRKLDWSGTWSFCNVMRMSPWQGQQISIKKLQWSHDQWLFW